MKARASALKGLTEEGTGRQERHSAVCPALDLGGQREGTGGDIEESTGVVSLCGGRGMSPDLPHPHCFCPEAHAGSPRTVPKYLPRLSITLLREPLSPALPAVQSLLLGLPCSLGKVLRSKISTCLSRVGWALSPFSTSKHHFGEDVLCHNCSKAEAVALSL